MKRVNLIRRNTLGEKPGYILDIGSSTGVFLDAMIRTGWKGKGVEVNPQAVDYARQKFNLDVDCANFEDTNPTNVLYDAVTMWDVLEHTYNPANVLRQVNAILKENGILAMTLPYWESFDRVVFGDYWIGYDIPRHLFVFSKPVLKKLLEKSGFSVITQSSGLSGYYTFLSSLQRWVKAKVKSKKLERFILQVLYFPGVRFVFQPFFSLLDIFGVGGSLVVMARKKAEH